MRVLVVAVLLAAATALHTPPAVLPARVRAAPSYVVDVDDPPAHTPHRGASRDRSLPGKARRRARRAR